MVLNEGKDAPGFELMDQEGKLHKLSDYLGKIVILYFYPKDDTPGCTVEACNFRDNFEVFKAAGVEILGISPDNVKSHAKFQQKHSLQFTLLADEDHKVCEVYGVWGPKKFMGKEYNGVYRTTYVIDEQGLIKKTFENVKPDEHAQEILNLLEK
jgi:peroxiredoxin Q/BCP